MFWWSIDAKKIDVDSWNSHGTDFSILPRQWLKGNFWHNKMNTSQEMLHLSFRFMQNFKWCQFYKLFQVVLCHQNLWATWDKLTLATTELSEGLILDDFLEFFFTFSLFSFLSHPSEYLAHMSVKSLEVMISIKRHSYDLFPNYWVQVHIPRLLGTDSESNHQAKLVKLLNLCVSFTCLWVKYPTFTKRSVFIFLVCRRS